MRLIQVRVVTRASRRRVEELGMDCFKVRVHSAPERGLANAEVKELLARYFGIPRSSVSLIKGERSRNKAFALDIPQDSRKITAHKKED